MWQGLSEPLAVGGGSPGFEQEGSERGGKGKQRGEQEAAIGTVDERCVRPAHARRGF